MSIQSTDIFRTLQSSYAQLLGLYPPQHSKEHLSEGEQKSLSSGKGMPPLRIRMAEDVNNKLGKAAIIDGYVQIPVFTYTEKSLHDDISFGGCSYVAKTDGFYWGNPQITFKNITGDFMSVLKEPITVAFNLTQA